MDTFKRANNLHSCGDRRLVKRLQGVCVFKPIRHVQSKSAFGSNAETIRCDARFPLPPPLPPPLPLPYSFVGLSVSSMVWCNGKPAVHGASVARYGAAGVDQMRSKRLFEIGSGSAFSPANVCKEVRRGGLWRDVLRRLLCCRRYGSRCGDTERRNCSQHHAVPMRRTRPTSTPWHSRPSVGMMSA